MFHGTKYTPNEMVTVLKRTGALATEADREVLLDVARMIAEIVVSAAVVRDKARKLYNERQAYAVADELVKPDAEASLAAASGDV